MKIEKQILSDKTIINLTGRLDTLTSPDLEKELIDICLNAKYIVFDLKNLQYVSSAGLRVLLKAHKDISKKGGRVIMKNVNETVMGVFEMTGFTDILSFK